MNTFCLNFPPFVDAQINNCIAQGKVTRKLEIKEKRRRHKGFYNIVKIKIAFMATTTTWLRNCLYGYDDIWDITNQMPDHQCC